MGRPKGSTKHTAAKESRARQATTKINENAKPGKIEAPEDEQEFVCICCGKRYKRQKQNFSASLSPLFAANNGRLPWCRHCIDTYFSQLIDYFSGNEAKAMERVCQIADLTAEMRSVRCTIARRNHRSRSPKGVRKITH